MESPASMSDGSLLAGVRFARRSIVKFDELEFRRPDLRAYARRERARFVVRLAELEAELAQRKQG